MAGSVRPDGRPGPVGRACSGPAAGWRARRSRVLAERATFVSQLLVKTE